MLAREALLDLRAAPMTMHVAEAADVHQNVEAETLAGVERAQQLVVPAAMAQAKINDLATFGGRKSLHPLLHLAIRIVTAGVNQRGCHLDFEVSLFDQINQWRLLDRGA